MQNIRQKVVSVLALLGIIIFFSRCSGDKTGQAEVAVVEHETAEQHGKVEVSGAVSESEEAKENPKTLFIKSEDDIASEKAESERLAEMRAQAERLEIEKAEAAKLAAQAEEIAQAEAEKESAKQEKIAQEKAIVDKKAKEIADEEKRVSKEEAMKQRIADEEAKVKQMQEDKIAIKAAKALIVQESTKMEASEREMELAKSLIAQESTKIEEGEKSIEEAKALIVQESSRQAEVAKSLKESELKLKIEFEKMKVDFESKQAEFEKNAKEAEAKATKFKVATAAAALLATQQAVAKSKADDEYATQLKAAEEKMAASLAKLEEEKKALKEAKAQIEASNAKFEESKLAFAKEQNASKIATEKATALEAQQAEMRAGIIDVEQSNKNSEDAKIEEKAKAEFEASKLAFAKDQNATQALKVQMESTQAELEKQKAELEASKLAFAKDQNATQSLKVQMESAKAELEKQKTEFAQNAKEAAAKSDKMKVAAVAAALLATQQAKTIAEEKSALEVARKTLEAEKVELEKQKVAQKLAQEQAKAIKEAAAKLHNVLALSRVEFKYNSADLTPKSERLLNKVAEVIKAQSNFNYAISGHTDAHGKESYNLKLSGERAEKVRAYLAGQGVDEGILTAQGFGSSQPIADNNTNEGRLQNRRVAIKIVE